MRLTLRTMLAYLDDMLEPADAEQIGQKIQESEFASGVVHRVRDVTRRLRLEAPRLRGRSMGVDPNTVAEYLDSTLSPERVPEFEKLCLESDMYLAEVASCHQILALVLAEPADVSPDSRQRMYDLIRHPESLEGGPDDEYPVVTPAPVTVPEIVERPRPEVPEYLREPSQGRSWWWQAAVLVGLLALIGGAVWMAVGPGQPRQLAATATPQPLAGEAEAGQPAGAADSPEDARTNGSSESAPSPGGIPATDPSPSAAESRATNGESAPPTPPAPATPSKAMPESSSPEAPTPERPIATAINGGVVQPDGSGRRPVAASPAAPEAATEEPPLPTDPEAGAAGVDAESADPLTPDVTADDPLAATAPETNPDVAEQLTSEPANVGRLVSAEQMLLQRGDAQWTRVTPSQVIQSGEEYVTLPTFRATLNLAAGLTAQLLGGSRVRWTVPRAGSSPADLGLELSEGRMVLMNVGRAGTTLELTVGSMQGRLVFVDAESSVALEVRPERPPGSDPEVELTPWAVTLFADSGEVTWQGELAGAETVIQAPAVRRLSGTGADPLATAPEFPQWITAERLKPIEEKAADAVVEALASDRPASLRLRELVEQRKEEVRALALRSLALLDDFEPVVAAVDDPRQRAYWTEHFDALVQGAARSSESAALIREALSDAPGAETGGELFRILWGYTPDQLRGAEGRKLVGYLDHEDQMFRVLAFCHLQKLAGRSLSYRPDDSPALRRSSVQRWRELFDNGELAEFAEGRAAPAGK